MKNEEIKKNKHLTLDDRIEIQQCLDHGMTFKATAARVGKDQTTVSKEVKKHLTFSATDVIHRDKNGVEKTPSVCPRLLKPPFVCNPCEKKRRKCNYQKQNYFGKVAQKEYEYLLVDAREGIPLNKEAFYENDRVISDAIKKGQHLYHILQTNNLGVSKSSVYRYLQKGYLSVSSIDFPRVVKFKPRRKKSGEYVPKAAKVGRLYEDFLAYIEENGITSWVEMDTVIGREGGKVIMTLDFTFCNFMVGLLLDSKSAADVATRVLSLKKKFAAKGLSFGDTFPLILTDNGGEFADVSTIENDLHGAKETTLFFCDPYKSCQKPKVEKNHTLFRDIVPKGRSFDGFTQDIVNLIFSHVNSVTRKVFNGKTPYEIFTFLHGVSISEIFGIVPISPEDVIQSPKLLEQFYKSNK